MKIVRISRKKDRDIGRLIIGHIFATYKELKGTLLFRYDYIGYKCKVELHSNRYEKIIGIDIC
ncbi:g005 [Yersinia phage phiR1-37]|uniref:hypothetical protein n=1 Tax=Yersinia phage phiR1-37 TaxID=331278 RepID=UPI00022DBCB1|nr:hypothetical protein phiR1-37_gp005 [Yersinia phage phiR1-37]CCE26029.1 g005 [Yersinia phage phiR1-37]